MKIYFDLDGTLVDLYGVCGWLEMLQDYDPTPYAIAKPLVNLSRLAYYLNRLQRMGHEIGVISWLSKDPNPEYGAMVTSAKMFWLAKHMPSVKWDAIHIVPYGVNKWDVAGQEGIIFDDDMRVRDSWGGESFDPSEIFEVFTKFVKAG